MSIKRWHKRTNILIVCLAKIEKGRFMVSKWGAGIQTGSVIFNAGW